jgi:hypothetical protein
MKTRFMPLVTAVAVVSGILLTPKVSLADGDTLASNNATVQPGGPRSGPNGKDFFNIEGSSNDPFDSFGVVDFQFPAGSTFNDGDLLSLTLAQANASFTTAGFSNADFQAPELSVGPVTVPERD